ncbi:Alkanesulfonate monooxygenase [Lecanosticta acicola]|uniref:Alkanesulfonate monooxygenase n=1 Tax=Lecanosticta acicola TaxID=111012 RepID=A0AAI8Z795_9PEZI|nr:Alkanesulfonate monooxygenase [Lecanosticta acicola]
MPSAYSNSPFLSLRPDSECGRTKLNGASSTKSFASLSGSASPTTNGKVNGHSGHANGSRDDEFLRLASPQQDLLLLHGPGQKYSLEKSKEIPELQGDREVLVQVLAIGLNPVDWKGADYGFSQPSYPWINGRDFAGIVVRGSRSSSRVQQGDVVFGASTDYRDVRKAAYQEYVVTTDYNVTRIPQGVTVKEGAALGVAYVAALVSLGVSFGLDLTNLRNAPAGPDFARLIRSLDPRELPEDIRGEVFSGIPQSERPQPGEWLVIWGAHSMTGQIALQIAKHAGLKVACVADIARGGARLSELGADFLVDKYDDKRAIEILKAVTGGKLRLGIDCNGKDSATSLQEALSQADTGLKSHILGLAGLPKHVGKGVVHHSVPIKIFHEAPSVGEAMSVWLEELLVAKSLKLPDVEIAEGGLAGINDALDRMRTGHISGKRIVVPVGAESRSGHQSPVTNGVVPNGISAPATDSHDLSYADELNSDPERVRFAYWVPNVSGGLVISKIKQRTSWDLKSNVRYARTAERVGFEYALSQIRFMAGYGADNQHEPVSFSQALLMSTERLKVIAALLPGPWNPAVAAKQIASIDNYSEGRVCVNVVSGWFRAEFASIGQWWLDHAERYRRSKEFIQCLKGIWTNDKFTFKGDFYQFHDYPLKPKPLNLPGRPYPEIFQGGNSDDAKENAGSVSDYYFMNGNTLEGFQTQISDVKERAKKNDREGQVGFALNAFVICRETEEEAIRVLQEIQGKADAEAVEGFRQQVQNAGSSTSNKSGMWANSKFEDLVQYNDGFKTKLIGTKEQIAERIVLLKSLGVSIILCAFLHYEEEIESFGKEVLPLVRELEAKGRGKDVEFEIARTGDVYRKNSEKSSVVQGHSHGESRGTLDVSAQTLRRCGAAVRSEDSEAVADTKQAALGRVIEATSQPPPIEEVSVLNTQRTAVTLEETSVMTPFQIAQQPKIPPGSAASRGMDPEVVKSPEALKTSDEREHLPEASSHRKEEECFHSKTPELNTDEGVLHVHDPCEQGGATLPSLSAPTTVDTIETAAQTSANARGAPTDEAAASRPWALQTQAGSIDSKVDSVVVVTPTSSVEEQQHLDDESVTTAKDSEDSQPPPGTDAAAPCVLPRSDNQPRVSTDPKVVSLDEGSQSLQGDLAISERPRSLPSASMESESRPAVSHEPRRESRDGGGFFRALRRGLSGRSRAGW